MLRETRRHNFAITEHDLILTETSHLQRKYVSLAEKNTIFGRITPPQNQHPVQALRCRNRYVAMIGDGVNDVLLLKQANLGVAMRSGSLATRGVADIVLLHDSFTALPQ